MPGDASPEKRTFFVSFNEADRPWATWIAWVLEEAGYSVLFQDWDFRGNFVEHMQRAHQKAERTLIVLSDHYLGSDFTLSEWSARFAEDPAARGDSLVPIKVGPVADRGLLSPLVYADLTGCDEAEAQRRLLNRVKKAVDASYRPKPPDRPYFPGAPARIIRNKPQFPTEEFGSVRLELKGHLREVLRLVFSPDGKTLASGDPNGTIYLWDPVSGQLRHHLKGHKRGVFGGELGITFSPDGKILASGGRDRVIRLWDPVSGQLRHKLVERVHKVMCLAFSPDGKTLASGSSDGTIDLRDSVSGQLRHHLKGHTKDVSSIAFSPDGRTLASGGFDKAIRLWDPISAQLLCQLVGHNRGVLAVAFSPDGKILASGGSDGTIRLWDPASGQFLRQLVGHPNTSILWSIVSAILGLGGTCSIAFSPDGRTLASGGFDKVIRLWDPISAQLLCQLVENSAWVLSLAFSPDGRTLASGDYDKTVRFWDIP